ncbi:EpsG family protein [Sphingobacterium sp. UT-1RO-CII-1]|uniref:EpsG family protein n=1 Tax=Sphingobacterium sp. UT-1RO-CII-1 TaxID=2995225 RepID=UPI00227B67F0|nr:EpsG family protein [Sphingobacterium sp. UT-1RO-CII-1]MCY4780799.1 EpsG family protein [Sphingobacterium sp. UT-1RO-CII-1]
MFFFFGAIDYFKIAINREQKKFLLIFLSIYLCLFAGLRYDCDNDYQEYVRIYTETPSLEQLISGSYYFSDVYGEPLFVVSNIVFVSLGAADYIFLTFISFLNIFFLYKNILGFSKYWFISIFLYVALLYLGGGFTQIRFGVAMNLAWFSLLKYYNGKFRLAYFFFLCAILFHVSAASALLIIITERLFKANTMTVLMAIGISILLTFLPLSDFLASSLSPFLGGSRYESYLESEVYSGKANSIAIYFYCISTLVFWSFRKQIILDIGEEKFLFLLKVSLMAVLFGALFNQIAILSRFGLILQFCYVFILPYTFGIRPIRRLMLFFLFLYAVFRFNQFMGESAFIQEYKSVITEKIVK